jgi:hypothetical protein
LTQPLAVLTSDGTAEDVDGVGVVKSFAAWETLLVLPALPVLGVGPEVVVKVLPPDAVVGVVSVFPVRPWTTSRT